MTYTLHLGDCLEYMRTMPAGSVDAVVTDPPYGTGAWKRERSGAGSDCRASLMVEEWDIWNPEWIKKIDCETVGLFIPQVNLIPFVRMFVWVKPDPRPRFAGQPSYGFEPFIIHRGRVHATGGTDYIIQSSPRENRDADASGHPHQKPLEVMLWAVSLCSDPGDTIFDPFMGSGTTGVACMQLGRNFIGCEIDPKYYAIAERRIHDASLQAPLFVDAPKRDEATQEGLI